MPEAPPSLIASLRSYATTAPGAPALSEGSTTLSYAELWERVRSVASALAGRGVGAGERVVLLGENTVPWVIAYLGILARGAIAVPANTRLSPEQFAAQTAFVGAALTFVDETFVDRAAGLGGPIALLERLASDAREPRDGDLAPLRGSDPAVISFTSGTTGIPKGAVLTHAALSAGSRVFADLLQTDASDSTLVLVPLFHNTGFVDQLGHMLSIGGHTILLRSFTTERAVRELAARQVTFITAVPSIIRLVMTNALAHEALARATGLLYGGSPMPRAWSAELAERWPALALYHGYGLTEFTSAVSFLSPTQAPDHLESVGTPVPGVDLRIVEEGGADVAEGDVGEIIVRGPTRMTRYWCAPELTAEKIRDGWLHTGDLGHREDGLLYLDGRVDDVINRGGEKVLPAFVESHLCAIPGVAEACVFPLEDPVLQQRVHAVVRLREGNATLDTGDVLARLRPSMPDYALPESISVWPDLPRGASGKVDRRAVVERITESEQV